MTYYFIPLHRLRLAACDNDDRLCRELNTATTTIFSAVTLICVWVEERFYVGSGG